MRKEGKKKVQSNQFIRIITVKKETEKGIMLFIPILLFSIICLFQMENVLTISLKKNSFKILKYNKNVNL